MAISKAIPKSTAKPKLKSSPRGAAGPRAVIADPALKPAQPRKKLGLKAAKPTAPTGDKVDKALAALVAEVAPLKPGIAPDDSVAEVAAADVPAEVSTETTTEVNAEASTETSTGAAAEDVVVMLRKKDMLQRLSERTGMRKNQLKPVMEAVLAELGDALIKGESLNLPPLGKLSVNRSIAQEKADVVICKLRRAKALAVSGVPETAAETENAISPLAVPDQ
jgi:DNA-binding protein